MDESENNRLAELLAELANGNLLVLSEIDFQMQKTLYKVGYPYYKNKEDTRDSIQELYLVLHKKAKHFHENVSARAWMVVVYKNFIKSDFRKRNREKRYIQKEMQAFKSQASTTIDKYVESRLVWKEVMDKLNDYEQSLLVYYLQAELTVRENAEVLHKPKSTIENHLQKVKEKIRKMQK